MQALALQKTKPLLIISVATMAVALGFLIASDQRIGWVIVVVFLLAALLTKAFRSLNVSLLLLFGSFVLTDLFRRLFAAYTGNWSFWGLLVIDIALVICYFSLYLPLLSGKKNLTNRSWQLQLPNTLKFVLMLYAFYIFIELFNPYYTNPLLSFAAFRNYLLSLPAIGLGLYVAQQWGKREWRRAYHIILFTIIGLSLFALLQLILEASYRGQFVQALLQPAEHSVHSWGMENVQLTSSVFASSKRFGRFLLFTYPLVWLYLRITQGRGIRIPIALLYLMGCLLSGSREAVFLFLFMVILLEGWKRAFTRAILMVALTGLLLTVFFGAEGTLQRISFVVSTPQDWLDRISYMFLDLPQFVFEQNMPPAIFLFGHGAGRGGQASQLVTQQIAAVSAEGSVRDAGLYLIWFDLGIIGLFLFLFLNGYLVSKAWPLRRSLRKNPYRLASGVAIMIWILLFTKTHSTISDQMVNVFFWGYVGVLLAKSEGVRFGAGRNT